MKSVIVFIFLVLSYCSGFSQTVKILFDATKAETAANADWVIDEDLNNMTWNPNATIGTGSEGNAQRFPTPAQNTVTISTLETYWKGALSAWGIDCVKKGYQVETLPSSGIISFGNTSNPQDLSNYTVFIIVEPNILFTAAEKTAILQFVQNGGGLFIVSDHASSDRNNDGKDSPQILNDLMRNNSLQSNPFGFLFDSVSISPNTTNIPNLANDSLLHGPMGGVTQALWASGNTITLYPGVNASVKGVVYIPSVPFGNTGVMACYSRFGKGKIVAIGDSSPCDDGTGDSGDNLYNGWTTDASGNHERLIMNGTIWLATKDTVLPPYLFTDISMDLIVAPDSLKKGKDTLVVRIKNSGTLTIDTATVGYQINNQPPVIHQLNGINLLQGKTMTYSFPELMDITRGGTFLIKMWVKNVEDTVIINDTLGLFQTVPLFVDAAVDSIYTLLGTNPRYVKVIARIRNTGESAISSLAIANYGCDGTVGITGGNSLNIQPNQFFLNELNWYMNFPDTSYCMYCIKILAVNGFPDDNKSNDSLCLLYKYIPSGIGENSATPDQVALFPNPSTEDQVGVQASQDIEKVIVRDLNGREIANMDFHSKDVKVKVEAEPGIYFVQVITQNGSVVKRWVKEGKN